MPRRPGRASGQFVFHVLNRAVQNTVIFRSLAEYEQFLGLLAEAAERFQVRVLAYCVMPNHWHLVVWPQSDDGLSRFVHWLAGTHAQRWRWAHGSQGRGAVYQGRFKAIAVQLDRHFLIVCRYVERNPLRARLVGRAEDWEWSSASLLSGCTGRPALSEWPVRKPAGWVGHLNEDLFDDSLSQVREAIRKGVHFGDAAWQKDTYEQLGWRSGRGPGCHHDWTPTPFGPDDSVIGF
jgi:putative transposase